MPIVRYNPSLPISRIRCVIAVILSTNSNRQDDHEKADLSDAKTMPDSLSSLVHKYSTIELTNKEHTNQT